MFSDPPSKSELEALLQNKNGTWSLPHLTHISQGCRKNSVLFWLTSSGYLHNVSLRTYGKNGEFLVEKHFFHLEFL